jgi:hypothetical protein
VYFRCEEIWGKLNYRCLGVIRAASGSWLLHAPDDRIAVVTGLSPAGSLAVAGLRLLPRAWSRGRVGLVVSAPAGWWSPDRVAPGFRRLPPRSVTGGRSAGGRSTVALNHDYGQQYSIAYEQLSKQETTKRE